MLPEGQQLDHYRLVRLLKSGGMGEVYLAEDQRLNRQVAIKVIHTDLTYFANIEAIREDIRLFLREARAAAQLDHPHILPLYDSGEISINGLPLMYMVMPLRLEGSLDEWLQRHPQQLFSPQEIASIVQQVASALQHAHDHQIVHLDVKPANFLIRSEHEGHLDLQLADFGVAKLLTASSQESQIIRGTPTYVAPEQWEGHPDPATDQYALAVMTYELLTRNVPFSGAQHEVMFKHLYVEPVAPSKIKPYLPSSIDTVLLCALRKKPTERYPSISAFADAFQLALNDQSDVRQIVTISPEEAQLGIQRILLLPGGRRVPVDIPSGVVHGQIIRLPGMGERGSGGQAGALILTVHIGAMAEVATLSSAHVLEKTVPAFNMQPSASPALSNRRPFPSSVLWLLPLVLLVIFGSGSLFYFTRAQAITNQKNATATARAHSTAIAFAQGATRTVNASNSATVVAQRAAAATSTSSTATVVAQAKLTATAATGATATAQAKQAATATVQAFDTAYATPSSEGTLQFNDPLQDNGRGYKWDEINSSNGGCTFPGDAYHASALSSGMSFPCFAHAASYGDIFYQVQMKIIKGDQGGLAFCADSSSDYYYFSVNENGSYALEIYKGGNPAPSPLTSGSRTAINTGLNQTNILAVHVKGGQIDLYINEQLVVSVNDSTLTQGEVGVVADDVSHPTEVAFSNAVLRSL
jgi:serine/threonine protein kinase